MKYDKISVNPAGCLAESDLQAKTRVRYGAEEGSSKNR